MKYLLTILFLLTAYFVNAQYIPNSAAYQYKGLKQTNSLQPPTGVVFPVTATNAPDSNYAAWYYNKADTSFYQFNPVPKTWTKLQSNGGIQITTDSIFITSIDSIFISNTDSIFIISGNDTIFIGMDTPAMDTAYQRNDSLFGVKSGSEFLIGITGSTSEIIPGGPFVTSNVNIGFDPGTNLSPAQVIQKVWYGTKPFATLGGGTTLELTNAATVSRTLNWGATRQTGAPTLSTIVVAGVSQTFVQPVPGATVNGTQDVDVPANVTTTYSNVVTASDAQTATANTTFTFLGRRYYGTISDTTGIGSGSQDAAILALNNDFATTKILSTNTGTITGIKFWVYAYPAVLGNLSQITFNAIPAIDAMNTTTKSFTNALGYTQNYIIYWNKQGQTTSSDITAQ